MNVLKRVGDLRPGDTRADDGSIVDDVAVGISGTVYVSYDHNSHAWACTPDTTYEIVVPDPPHWAEQVLDALDAWLADLPDTVWRHNVEAQLRELRRKYARP